MSFEIIGQTRYAPLNTQIDADRDYRDLTGDMQGLDACACDGSMPQHIIPPGSGYVVPGRGLQGLEAENPIVPVPSAESGSNTTLWVLLLLAGAAGWWLWRQPDEEMW